MVKRKKKGSFAIWVFRTPLPFCAAQPAALQMAYQKRRFINLNKFTFGKLQRVLHWPTHMQKDSSICFTQLLALFCVTCKSFSAIPSKCKTIFAITCRFKGSIAISKKPCPHLQIPKILVICYCFRHNFSSRLDI